MNVDLHKPAHPVIRHPGEASAFWTMGQLLVRQLGGDESGGEVAVTETRMPGGLATPLHIHSRESELGYVLEGEVDFRCGEETRRCGPGGFFYLPKGFPHAFKVAPAGARVLFVALPAGIERLYEEVGVPAERMELPNLPPEIARWLELSHSYGIQVVGPPLS